jgi:hypothetical protein
MVLSTRWSTIPMIALAGQDCVRYVMWTGRENIFKGSGKKTEKK